MLIGRRRRLAGMIIIAALCAAGAYAFYKARPPRRPNVLVLLLDTLRADHLSLNGYERDTSPVLDSFARENLNFSYAISASPWTPTSVATIFTGVYPSVHGMMPINDRAAARRMSAKLPDEAETIAETLKKNGYQTAAVISNPWMKPEFGLGQGFDTYTYLHRVHSNHVNQAAYKHVRKLRQKSEPFFLYLHYMDVHNPYNPPGAYAEMYKGPLKSRAYPEKQVRLMGRYDGAIRYLDNNLGELFSFLKEEKLYDDLAIVVLADHGEQFMEQGRQGHGYHLFNEELRVPLMIKAPGRAGAIDQPVSLVDLYPTMLELAGVPLAKPVQGVSLISRLDVRKQHGMLAEIRRNYNSKAYISPEGAKLILDYKLDVPLVAQADQAAEQAALLGRPEGFGPEPVVKDSALEQKLRSDFQGLYRKCLDLRQDSAGGEVEIDQDTVKELESLGYM
jgi:arylsulfatase A-like enzyme